MEAQIQIRRSTAAQWISANPILASGEPGLETDTGKGKYGDGVTHWVSLGYSWQLLGAGPTGAAGGSLAGTYPNPTLALATVGPPQIIDGGVGAAELATNAVTSVKIADLNVTTAKLADGAVTGAKLAPGGIGSAQIADGSIGLADLAPATVSGLKLDVMDEGAVKQADADIINFIGEGVSVASGSGIATVTISGAPASAILAGTIGEWADSTPPAGWYLCDGTVHADMAGTLGTRYGPTAGTVPFFFPVVTDGFTTTISDVIASTQPGYQVNSVMGKRQGGTVSLMIQTTRTGATIGLGNPGHADQVMCSTKPMWTPDNGVAGCYNNVPRWGILSSGGNVTLTAGFANDNVDHYDLLRDDVLVATYSFPAPQTRGIPVTYKIIKAPTVAGP